MNSIETDRLIARLTAEYDQLGEPAERCEFLARLAGATASDPKCLAGLLMAAHDGAESSGRTRTTAAIFKAFQSLSHKEWDPERGMRQCPQDGPRQRRR